MKRSWRILTLTVRTVAVSMFILTVLLYWRQLSHRDYIKVFLDDSSQVTVISNGGVLDCYYNKYGALAPKIFRSVDHQFGTVGYLHETRDPEMDQFQWSFNFRSDLKRSRTPSVHLTLPVWSVAVLSMPIFVWWGFMCSRWRRNRTGDHPVCPHCNYDLHGVTATTCPECGASTA